MKTNYQLDYTDRIKKIFLGIFAVFYIFHIYFVLWTTHIFANIQDIVITNILYKLGYLFIVSVPDTAFYLLLKVFVKYPDMEAFLGLSISILFFLSLIEIIAKHETKLELYVVE